MKQRFRCAWIGHIDDRGAVEFRAPIERVDLGNAAVMPDISDPAIALLLDFRVIGAARVQIDMAQQRHVAGFRLTRVVFRRRTRRGTAATDQHTAEQQRYRPDTCTPY